MNEDKNQLEIKINKTVIDIFAFKNSTVEKTDDFDESEYKALRTKLADLIWRWAKIVYSSKIENASVEIMDCIRRSLSSFNGNTDTEGYIKYIAASLKKEIERANQKEQVFEKELISIPEKKQQRIKTILKYTNACGKNIDTQEDLKHICDTLNVEYSDAKDLLQWKKQADVLSDCSVSSDNEDYSLIDSFISEHNFTYNPEKSFFNNEEKQEFERKVEKLFVMIDNLYLQEKDKTDNQKLAKRYLSSLITRQLFDKLSKINNLDKEKICSLLEGKNFVDTSMMQLFKENKIPSQQEVAEQYSKDKTDASRKLKTFLQKLQEKMSTEIIVDSSV